MLLIVFFEALTPPPSPPEFAQSNKASAFCNLAKPYLGGVNAAYLQRTAEYGLLVLQDEATEYPIDGNHGLDREKLCISTAATGEDGCRNDVRRLLCTRRCLLSTTCKSSRCCTTSKRARKG